MAANSPTRVTSSNINDVEGKLTDQFSRLVQEIVAIQDVERAKKAKVRVNDLRNIVHAMEFDDVPQESVGQMVAALEAALAPVEDYQCHVAGVTEVLVEPLEELRAELTRLGAKNVNRTP